MWVYLIAIKKYAHIYLYSRRKCEQIGPGLILNMEGGATAVVVMLVILLLMMMTLAMRLERICSTQPLALHLGTVDLTELNGQDRREWTAII